MATRFIDKEYGLDTSTAIADDATGRAKVRNLPDATGLNYDKVSNTFKFNGNDHVYELVDTASAQTITGVKTFSAAPIVAGGTFTSPVLVTPSGVMVAQETLFTQVAGNKTHTASFTIPAGATIQDILITNSVVWNSDTSATLKAGISGGDDDCFFTALNVKTTPAAGKTINFSNPGAANGASIPAIDGGAAATQLGAANGFLYNATSVVVAVVVTDVNVSGTAGRTRVTVLYSLPSSVIAPVVA